MQFFDEFDAEQFDQLEGAETTYGGDFDEVITDP